MLFSGLKCIDGTVCKTFSYDSNEFSLNCYIFSSLYAFFMSNVNVDIYPFSITGNDSKLATVCSGDGEPTEDYSS